MSSTSRTGRWRWMIGGVVVVVAAWLMLLAPVESTASTALAWVEGLGPASYGVFVVLYVVMAVLLLPASAMTIAAGFLWGPVVGTVVVSAASTLGAGAAFLMGRGVAHEFVVRRVGRFPRFHAVYRAVEREEFKVVLLLRLVPLVPYNVLNYALGLTRVGLGRYLLASWIGMFPATLVYVYAGSVAQSLTAASAGQVARGPWQVGLFVVAGFGAVALFVLLGRRAREEFDALMEEGEDRSADEGDEGSWGP